MQKEYFDMKIQFYANELFQVLEDTHLAYATIGNK